MYDSVFYQNSFDLIKSDIQNSTLPGAILLSGPEFSGKFTAALEIARILSCFENGAVECECESCRRNRTLTNMNVLIAGNRDCMLEIEAMKSAFLQGFPVLPFIRSVHKLTSRFNHVLWAESDKISKFPPIIEGIEDGLAELNSASVDASKVEKISDGIMNNCEKLQSFLYDSLPIDQVRGASSWLRVASSCGKKVFIIENAERMLEAARNALLKILEEPPADAVFILTTSKRGAMMQTILSRVRTYSFYERSEIQQKEIVENVFHQTSFSKISDCLYSFLPKTPTEVKNIALGYYDAIKKGQIPSVDFVVKGCASFEPRMLFKAFLNGVMDASGDFSASSLNAAIAEKNLRSIQECFNNVTVYNQSATSAIEKLTRDLSMNIRSMK